MKPNRAPRRSTSRRPCEGGLLLVLSVSGAMSYLVLARKYRPLTFASVSGQEHVTRTLRNAIRRGKVAHAYLFAGPRGVGKTSIARIFSKALNCAQARDGEPCGECTNCHEIAIGTSLAVREIDGASHNSVDNVRELIESFRALPAAGSIYKIYIIDEVHMLSTAAFNALLKSLEEPPPHTVFIMATTEAHKIPETVLSRCQRYDFKGLPLETIINRLEEICKSEKIAIEPEAVQMIARLADGSLRDSQSLLDRVQSFCEGKITAEEAGVVLGTVAHGALRDLGNAVVSRQAASAVSVLGEILNAGVDIGHFLKEFVTFWRNMLMARVAEAAELRRLAISDTEATDLKQLSKGLSLQDLQDLVTLARQGADLCLRSTYPRVGLEALIVQLATREPVRMISELLQELKTTKPAVSNAGSPARALSVAPRAVVTEKKSSDWSGFVDYLLSHGHKILAEPVKRLVVSEFTAGKLAAHGPDFSIKYLKQEANQKKLIELLKAFSGQDLWKLDLSNGGGEAESESVHGRELAAKAAKNQKTAQDASIHPQVQTLQKAFPGSKIESIRVKE